MVCDHGADSSQVVAGLAADGLAGLGVVAYRCERFDAFPKHERPGIGRSVDDAVTSG